MHEHGVAGATPVATRRRAIRIIAAVAGLPLLGAGVRALSPAPQFFTWQGEVLGAVSEVALWDFDKRRADHAFIRIEAELDRYHRMFSLFRDDSEIARLNRDGVLDAPSRELVALVDRSLRLGVVSGGAFDISVQPLWNIYESHFWLKRDSGSDADAVARARDAARDLVDFRRIDVGSRRIGFGKPDMAITLNGIAQGYITEQIVGMLRSEGFETGCVDLGEFSTIGMHPDGRPWRLGIKDPRNPALIGRSVDLADMAMAVSGGYGTPFDSSGTYHHIFDPATGESARKLISVAVIGPSAAAADGLSTAICVTGEAGAPALLAAYPGTYAIITRPDGTWLTVRADCSIVPA